MNDAVIERSLLAQSSEVSGQSRVLCQFFDSLNHERGGTGSSPLYGEQGAPLEQGWLSGESTRLPPMWPRFDSQTRRDGVICALSLLLAFVLPPRGFRRGGFPPGTPVFPSPQKPTITNSNSIWIAMELCATKI